MTFPLYRKLSNEQSYYLITSYETLVEYKFTGKNVDLFYFNAKTYFDKLFIQEIIKNAGYYQKSTLEEFRKKKIIK